MYFVPLNDFMSFVSRLISMLVWDITVPVHTLCGREYAVTIVTSPLSVGL